MASPARSRLVSPEVRTSVREPRHIAELGDMTRRLPVTTRAGGPLKLVGRDGAERYRWNVSQRCLSGPSQRLCFRARRLPALVRSSSLGEPGPNVRFGRGEKRAAWRNLGLTTTRYQARPTSHA